MRCSACDFENPAGLSFCGACGERMAAGCAACGFANPPGFKFCGSCGAALGGAARPPAQLNVGAGDPSALSAAPRDYTPRHLAEKILQSRSALEGERKQVTVLFVDVKSSMEIAGRLDPEQWHAVLDRFFQILADGVHRFEGTVNQYTGDGIMALFGAPIAHEDHAQRACYAALHLTDALRQHAREVRREHGLDFAFRMGLNSGDVVVGKIGDDLRMDYTAQGHTVGLAQRMESLAEADSCFVSDATAVRVARYFDLEALGDFRVKGMSEPVRVHRLTGLGAARTRFDVSRARGLTRFVGRADEMRTLEAALERARAGYGSLVGVVAEAGTGKSRLCFEFLAASRAAGCSVHTGRAVAHGKSIPLVPILEIYRSYYGIGERDDARTAREKIAGKLLLLDDGYRDALPVLFDFLGVTDPAEPAPRMEPEERQRRLFHVLRRLLQMPGADGPMLILIEDLHWLDEASQAWVAEYADAIAGTHNLALVNFRPEYRAAWMGRSHYQQIALAPLGADAIRELLVDLLGSDPSTDGLADAIYERTRGNPFFAEEIVRTLIETGGLAGARGSYRLAAPIERLDVPDSVQALLAARIDRLEERDKRVLQTAAVIGKQFRGPVLERVADVSAAVLSESLSALRDAEFIHEESLYPVAAYAFKHPLTQEVALGSQLRERRRAVHASVARAIEALDADKLDEQSALLAHHWEESGAIDTAARWHARAAAWAMRSDVTQAYRHWWRVKELTATLPAGQGQDLAGLAHRELVNVGWRGGLPVNEIRPLFAEGRRILEESGDARSLALLYSNYSLAGGVHSSERVECYRQANRLAAGTSDLDLQVAVGAAVFPLAFAGRIREALDQADATLAMIRPGKTLGPGLLHFDPYPWLFSARGWCRALLGDFPAAVADSDRGIELALREGEEYDRLLAYSLRARIDTWRGELTGALEHGRRQYELAERIGGATNRLFAMATVGYALVANGLFRESLTLLEQQAALTFELESYQMSRGLPMALLACGDAGRAVSMAREQLAYAVASGGALNELEANVELGVVVARAGGDPREARAALARADELCSRIEARAFAPEIHEATALLHERLGEHEACARELDEARRMYDAMGAVGHARRVASRLS